MVRSNEAGCDVGYCDALPADFEIKVYVLPDVEAVHMLHHIDPHRIYMQAPATTIIPVQR